MTKYKKLSRRELLEEKLRLYQNAVIPESNKKYMEARIRLIEAELIEYILLDVEDENE